MYIEPVEIIKNSVLTITLSLIMIAFFDVIVLLVSMINNRYVKIILEVKDFILVFFCKGAIISRRKEVLKWNIKNITN